MAEILRGADARSDTQRTVASYAHVETAVPAGSPGRSFDMQLRLGSLITPFMMMSLMVVVAAVGMVFARQSDPAEMAFEAARKTEIIERDIRGAIVKYREVVSRYSSNRAVAANALARLAACYEQLGQPEALVAYQRIVREFGDITPVAAIARRWKPPPGAMARFSVCASASSPMLGRTF